MEQILVNQAYLLSLIANTQKFIVAGIYDNGLMMKAARTKTEKESESARMNTLKYQLKQLGIDCTVTKLASMQNQVELKINS
ncbi:MAG: hypothetical protein WCT07_04610 [Candidatus Paceibacterota bacterium]